MTAGERRRVCKKRIIRRCKLEGLTVCLPPVVNTTTTTTTAGVTSSTTSTTATTPTTSTMGTTSTTSSTASTTTITTPPNVLIILTDDQRIETLPYMPEVAARLTAPGVAFENAVVTTPQCCPSRAGLLTGQTLHRLDLGNTYEPALGFHTSGGDTNTLATALKARGYRTGLFGKYMNGNDRLAPVIPPGWDVWRTFTVYGYEDYTLNADGALLAVGDGYSTDDLAEQVVDFIRENAESPWFAIYAPFAPHGPLTPAPRHAGMFALLPDWPVPNDPFEDNPPWMAAALPISNLAAAQTSRRLQLETLLAVDEAVGRLLDTLEEAQLLDRSLIVYTSDNGYLWGEHRYEGKLLGYEPSIRVPLIVLAPDGVSGASPLLASQLDVAATILDYADATLPNVQGLSLRPAITGADSPPTWHDALLIELLPRYLFGFIPMPYDGLRTPRWKFLVTHDPFFGEYEELYDIVADPNELDNLRVSARAETQAVRDSLAARLSQLKAE